MWWTNKGYPRSSAACAAITASMARWRSSAISASVSVRSGARNRSAKAMLRRPAPSASDWNTSNGRTSSRRSPAVSRSVRAIAFAGNGVGYHEGEIDRRRRKARRRAELAVAPGCGDEGVEHDFERHHRTLEPERVDHRVRHFADRAHVGTAGEHPSAAAGTEARNVSRLERERFDLERVDNGAERVDRVVHVDGAIVLHRPASHRARHRHREMLGFLRERPGALGRGEEDVALFEEGDVVQSVRAVERDRLQQPREHARAQHRLLGAERIRGTHQPIDGRAGPLEAGG